MVDQRWSSFIRSPVIIAVRSYAGWRAKIDDLVESTETDGIFEVVIEQRG